MEDKISSNLTSAGQKLIHCIQIKLRVGPAKSERYAVFSNTYFSIFQKNECKKSFLWIELSCIKVTDKYITLKFGKNVFNIFPTDIKLFLSCIFDVIQRVLLPSELEKLDFYSFHSFVALPNPFSVSSRIRMKIEESGIKYDRSLVQSITDNLSYTRKELDLSKFDLELLPFIIDAIPLYLGIRSIKIASSGKVDAYQYVSKLALEKTNLRLIDVKGYSNSNFDNYITNISLNKSPKLLTLSFESSFFQESQLNLIKKMYKKSNLKGLEFHDAISPQAFDFFQDSFFLSLNLKSLNLDGTRGINLPRILILVPGLVLLSLENCDLDISDVIVQIQNLQKLRLLNLSGNRCTNYAKLRTQLPPNVLSVYVNNVTWEKQCLVEFFKYRLMKLSISYISTSSDEWQRLFDSLPENQNNTLASIIWDGNNLHTNFFNYLKNQVCLNYLSLNDCFSQHHVECISYLIDYLKFQDLGLNEISLRGTESNNIGEYLPNILNIIMRTTKIHTIDVHGQRGGDQSIITIMENMESMKIISCDKMNLTKSALLFDLAEKANSYKVWLSYPSEDILALVHTNKLSASDSRTLYNKFRMLPKRIKKQPPRVLYPPPSSSAFDFPFQVYKYYPENEFPRYLKEKQLAFYEKAPPMAKVVPTIKLPNGQKQAVPSPQPSPPKPSQIQTITTFGPQEHQSPAKLNDNPDPTLTLGSPLNNQMSQTYNRQSPSNYNRQSPSNYRINQQNFNRSSPASKGRQTGSTSPNSIYKETIRPPPPRFVFEDDPITLEMSREDETILPTIDEEFFPVYDNNNYNNNNYNNNNYNNNNYNNNDYKNNDYNNNDYNNNYNRSSKANNLTNRSRYNNSRSQRQIYEEEKSQSRNRQRSSPSRNERSTSRNIRKIEERIEEENFSNYDEYEYDDQKVFQASSRKRRYENEDEEKIHRPPKSRQVQTRSTRNTRTNAANQSPPGRGSRRSTSRQHHKHRSRYNNNNDDYDVEDDGNNEEFFDYENENNDYEEESQKRRRRSSSRPRKVPLTDHARRNKPKLNYEDEGDFDENNDDYDDQNSLKKRQRKRKRTPTSRNREVISRTPSPYSNHKQAQSQRPRQNQSKLKQHQHQHQNEQPLSRSQHRRAQPSRNMNNRNIEIDDNDDIDEYDEYNYNYSEDNIPNYKIKAQSQRRSQNVQQRQIPKPQKRGQSHRPRIKKLKNDENDDYENNDSSDDGNDDDEYYRQPNTRHQHHQHQNKVRPSKTQVQKRTTAAPEKKKQNIEKNREVPNRQQSHSRSRNRANNQRKYNYNKDFDEDNNFNDDDYDDNFVNNNVDDSQSYSVKRKGHSQKNSSRSQSKKQHSDYSHTQRIVRNIYHDGSPKPSRRPAPKYVKEFSFSSTDSYE